MRKMKDSGVEWIGKIPYDWEIKKYKNYCNVFAGGTPNTEYKEYYDGNIPWIQSGKIQFCDINDCSRYITEKGLNNSSTKLIKKNTALLAMTGATCGNVGFLKFPCCANQSVMAFESNGLINDRFIYYSLMIQEHAIKIKQNGSAQSGINVENGKNMLFAYCNINEQELIANYLDNKVKEIDNIVLKTQETIEEYKKYKQSVITEAVTKGLNPNVEMRDSGIEWIGEIPKGWDVRSIKSMIDNVKNEKNLAYNTKVLSLSINGVKIKENLNEGMNPSSYIGHQLVSEGDLVICLRDLDGSFLCGVSKYDGCISNLYYVINFKDINLYFLDYLFHSMDYIGILDGFSYGMRHSYNISQFGSFNVALANIQEQDSIVNYLDNKVSKIDNLILKKQELITQLENYKKSLVYEYVTGKKEVPR